MNKEDILILIELLEFTEYGTRYKVLYDGITYYFKITEYDAKLYTNMGDTFYVVKFDDKPSYKGTFPVVRKLNSDGHEKIYHELKKAFKVKYRKLLIEGLL